MTFNTKPITLSIKKLLSSDHYIIPTYQRNYAWGVDELAQLIQDVTDYASENPKGRYYIGTLVVFPKRDERGGVIYETVDGQQRLTTLNIILCALKNELALNNIDWYEQVNVSFEYRKKSNLTLDVIFTHNDVNQYEELNEDILDVYNNCVVKINAILRQKNLPIDQFIEYFLNNVNIVRVCVPEQTDLNHYFEIMNSRGVQLEMHEILKATLLDILKNGKNGTTDSLLAADIWESCSVMNRYVQMGFSKERRNIIFATDWNHFGWKCTNDLFNEQKLGYQVNESKGYSLMDVVKGLVDENTASSDDDKLYASNFTPVINFPNFLLQVLEIQTNKEISLDDKQLLKEFDRNLPSNGEQRITFVKDFFFNLLKARYFLDKFVAKREYTQSTEQWSIKRINNYNSDNYGYISTFDDDDNLDKLIKLHTMFHVTYTAQYRKYWLNGCLRYLFKNYNDNRAEQIDICDYSDYLEKVAKAYVCDRYLCHEDNSRPFREIIISPTAIKNQKENLNFNYLDNGTYVERFMFNYLDYLLWKADRKKWRDFDFSFRSSIEHFYPQNPLDMEKMDDGPLNSFGNLCLISRSMNSKLSNYSPIAKKDHYIKNRVIESIKQIIMMEPVTSNSDWNVAAIKAHGDAMKKMIEDSLD